MTTPPSPRNRLRARSRALRSRRGDFLESRYAENGRVCAHELFLHSASYYQFLPHSCHDTWHNLNVSRLLRYDVGVLAVSIFGTSVGPLGPRSALPGFKKRTSVVPYRKSRSRPSYSTAVRRSSPLQSFLPPRVPMIRSVSNVPLADRTVVRMGEFPVVHPW